MRRLIIVIVSIATVVSAAVLGGVGYGVASGHGTGTAQSRTGAVTSCYATGNGDLRVVQAGDRCRAGENRLTLAQRAAPVVHVVGRTGQPPYLDGFRAYNGPPFGDLAYFKDGSGVVHLQGLACLASGALCAVQTMVGGTRRVFRLPLAFRPADSRVYTGLSVGLSDNYYNPRIDVTRDGYVQVIAPPSAGMDWISFDGITFLAKPVA